MTDFEALLEQGATVKQKLVAFGQTPKMLTQQLRELEHDKLITRKVYAQVPPKVEYALSEFGRTLEPILEMIALWGTNYNQQIVEILERESATVS